MGNKDKTRDRNAATADRDHSHSQANRDHSQDWEAARDTMLAKTIAEAVAVALAKQKAEETQSITEAFTRQWRRHMHNMRSFSRKVMQPPYQLPLKLLHQQMALE